MTKNEKYSFCELADGTVTNRIIINVNDYKFNPTDKELYRGLFRFDSTFREHFLKFKSIKGFSGSCWSECLVIDVDSDDLDKAKQETIKFCELLNIVFELDTRFIDLSFSGAKGFHITLDSKIFGGFEPSETLPAVLKSIMKELSNGFECIDLAIYNRSRLFRVKNSVNYKSGLYKIPLTYQELSSLTIDEIKQIARKPRTIESLPKSDIIINQGLMELYQKNCNIKPVKTDAKELNIFSKVETGKRHNHAIEIISYLRNKGIDNQPLEYILKSWNISLSEPLSEKEIKSIINSTNDWNKEEEIEIISLERGLDLYQSFVESLKTDKIALGYNKLDKNLRALVPGEVLQIQGATGFGKSMLALNISKNYVESVPKPILYFSLEMPSISLIERICQLKLKKSGFEIENDFQDSKAKLFYSQKLDAMKNLFFVEKSNLSLSSIERYIDYFRCNINQDLNFIIVDYLGLVKHKGFNLYEKMSDLSRNLKLLAKNKKVFVLSLIQINRNGQARDSGSIEESCDYLLSIEKPQESEFIENDDNIELTILKNRKGGLNKINMIFDKRDLSFKEI